MKKISIATKLIIGFSFVLIISGIIGVVGYFGMQKMKQAQEEFISVRLPAVGAIQTFMESIRSISLGERGMMINGMLKDPEIRKKQYSTGAMGRIKSKREVYKNLPLTAKEDSLLNEFDKRWDAWMSAHNIFLTKAEEKGALFDQGENENSPIMQQLDIEMMALILESRMGYLPVNDIIEELNVYTLQLIDSSHKATVKLSEKAQLNLIIMVITALLAAILMVVVVTKAILTPIKEGLKFTEKLAKGDLTSTIKAKNNDEIGQMITALNSTANKLNAIVSSIKYSSGELTAASSQLNSASQEMAQGANEQASASEEVASSLEEMSATIQQNSDNARSTEIIAKKAAIEITAGTDSAQKAITSMNEIESNIKIISDIAVQTNLLALNAAVEAASAGVAGRGFSVVAAEVKKLAEKSRSAATIINTITDQTVRLSTATGEKLEEVTPNIQETAKLVNEITVSNMELLEGVEHINSAMGQLNMSTMSTVKNSEEIASNAEKLMAHAEQLKGLVNFFTTNDNNFKAVQKKTTITKKQVEEEYDTFA